MHHTSKLVVGVSLALVLSASASAQEKAAAPHKTAGKVHAAATHVMLNAADLQWGPAPPGLPAGSQVALLAGNPGASGRYTVRMKAPDGYKIPAHWHPTGENLTVISGTALLSSGEKLDEASAVSLSTGAYAAMPPRMKHALWCKGETEIQISGDGPFAITYVNPADNPRKAAAAK